MALYVDLLGPVGWRSGEVARPVSGVRRKAVLAVLALHPGEVVSTDRLIETVWSGDPPASAPNALQHHVAYLRRAAGDPGAIVSRQAGYLLDVPADRVDAVRAERLVRRARAAGEPARAAELARAALGLWHGDALLDVAADGWLAAQAGRLEEVRLDAGEALAEARLALGEHAAVVVDLERWVARHPWRERLHGQLMLALYRGGRQAEALEVYQRLRRTMADELGLDPGPAIRERAAAILRRDPDLDVAAPSGAWVTPAQLPFAVATFSGRTAELAALDTAVADRAGLAVVVGPPGVGKTTLAVTWAHRVAAGFPDGQIFVDLRGFDPDGPARDPAEVTRELLEALGVPTHRIPAGEAAQTALYRSLLAGRRVLVVLDNAGDAAQVRPLLPGSRSAFVLVTSRLDMTALVAGAGARPVRLDVLDRSQALELLTDRLGPARLAAEPAAVDEVLQRCAGLPLALVFAAARADVRPGFPFAAFAAELREETRVLDALGAGHDGVRAVLCLSVRAVSEESAQLLRWIALHPQTDFGVAVAASLTGLPVGVVAKHVAELTRANLVDERTAGRYSVHALLRTYQVEESLRLDRPDDRAAAERRMFDHYLATAYAAARRLEPLLPPIDVPAPVDGVTVEAFDTAAAASAWFAAERTALLGVQYRAYEQGHDGHAWRMAWAVVGYLVRAGYWADGERAHDVALRAASRAGEPAGVAHAHCGLGVGFVLSGRFALATPHLDRAADLFRSLGDRANLINVIMRQCLLYDKQDRVDDALRTARSAYAILRPGDPDGVRSRVLNVLGWCHTRLGEHAIAIRYTEEAVALAGDEPNWLAGAWDTLGAAYAGLGEWRPAIGFFERAIALNRTAGDRTCEAESLLRVGDAYAAAGDNGAAVRSWRAAAALFDVLKHPGAERARAQLAATSR